MRHLRVAAVACALVIVAHAAVQDDESPWELAAPAPTVPIRPAHVDIEGHACAECHAEVVEEWASTTHAIAWVDEAYLEYLEDVQRKDGCYSCHAPQPLLAGGGPPPRRPSTREGDRMHGVDCASCHLGPEGAWLGATGASTDAHATAQSDHLANADALCASCHGTTIGPVVGLARDFTTSEQADRGRSCVGCHMAPRPLPADAPADARPGRSHAMQTPRDPGFLRRAFELRHVERGGESVLVIENQAGHRVPGLKGREIRFVVSGAGQKVERVIDTRAHLKVDGSIEVPLGALADTLKVEGHHLDPRATAEEAFLDETLERE
ncbi:MAG: multiheme c-type cytochrome [Planctomycetota bacterium]|nr:multiheme c-type cytochrome [Planctomycetota bacterium]